MDKLYTILFKVPELQRKILMTAMFLAIYRIGFYIPLPIVDQDEAPELAGSAEHRRPPARSSAPSPCSAAPRSA